MKTAAIILAGGTGRRIGADIPKQLLKTGGRTIIEYTISAFEEHSLIDEICIVSHADWITQTEALVSRAGFRKVKHIITGGKERSDSSQAAIRLYEADDILLIHDGARPLVSRRIISDCVSAMKSCNAAGVAIPATDTVWQADTSRQLCTIPPRETLFLAQTPQVFRCSVIAEAYSLAAADTDFRPTDDCSVVARYLKKEKIKIIEGDSRNIKITNPQDLLLMQMLLEKKEQTKL